MAKPPEMARNRAAMAAAVWLFVDQFGWVATVIGCPVLALGVTALVASGASSQSLIGKWRFPGAGAIVAMAYSLYLTHKQVYGLTHAFVGERLDTQPILAVFVYGGAAVAAGALLYAIAERPALLLRSRVLRGLGESRGSRRMSTLFSKNALSDR
jgi:hypothetical protein